MQYLYLCPICLILAAIFIFIENLKSYVVADVIKGVASGFFVAFGILGALKCPDSRLAWTVVAGLTLGAIADVVLNLRYVYEGKKGQLAFIVGILIFLAGHVVYVAACVPYSGDALPIAIVLGIVLAAALLYWIFARIEAQMVFKIFGVFYIGAIAILNAVALVVLIGHVNAHWLVFLFGSLLFLVSDVILILNTFGPRKSFLMRVSNLMLYYIGQLMIAASLQLPL